MKFLIGVDEAGRGPLAGPVAVGVVIAPAFFDIKENFPGVADSKTLSPDKREELFTKLEAFANAGALRWVVTFASARTIDTKGLTYAVRSCVYKGVRTLAPREASGQAPSGYHVLLDGLLRAPPEYAQQTIIGGDFSEPIISLASIAAKVKRDRLMRRLAKKYPAYGFEMHKGYGTAKHHEAIVQFGPCAIHRRTWIKDYGKISGRVV